MVGLVTPVGAETWKMEQYVHLGLPIGSQPTAEAMGYAVLTESRSSWWRQGEARQAEHRADSNRSDQREYLSFLTPCRAQQPGNLAGGHALSFKEEVRFPKASW